MAMSARVTRMNGRIIGEKRGGVMRRFSHDPQGNTVAAYDSSGNLTDTFVYWPNGEVRVRTGSSTIPYQYSGAWGSYTDTSGRNYNVARYLRKDLARWMTVDPLWPAEYAYGYAGLSPVLLADPLGTDPISVSINAFINSKTYGKRINVGNFGRFWGARGLLESGTDRHPYDRNGSNRGRADIALDSLGIGYGAPSLKTYVGRTTVYLAGQKIIDRHGHKYVYDPESGFKKCKNSWLRVHIRYCAALVPNSEEFCIDHRFTIVFSIFAPNAVSVEVKQMQIDQFPDMDGWIHVNGRFLGDWFHIPAAIGVGQLHPFLGLAATWFPPCQTYIFAAPTPPACNTGVVGDL